MLKKDKSTEENRTFWEYVEKTAEESRTGKWQKGAVGESSTASGNRPLKTCPFCGSSDLERDMTEDLVICKCCEASAPYGTWLFRTKAPVVSKDPTGLDVHTTASVAVKCYLCGRIVPWSESYGIGCGDYECRECAEKSYKYEEGYSD